MPYERNTGGSRTTNMSSSYTFTSHVITILSMRTEAANRIRKKMGQKLTLRHGYHKKHTHAKSGRVGKT